MPELVSDAFAADLEPTLESGYEPCSAELAECTCPDFCERDHAND